MHTMNKCACFFLSFFIFLARFHVLDTFVHFLHLCLFPLFAIYSKTTPMDKLGLQRFGCFATATRGCGSCVIQMTKPSTVLFHYSFIIYYLLSIMSFCHWTYHYRKECDSCRLLFWFFSFLLWFLFLSTCNWKRVGLITIRVLIRTRSFKPVDLICQNSMFINKHIIWSDQSRNKLDKTWPIAWYMIMQIK